MNRPICINFSMSSLARFFAGCLALCMLLPFGFMTRPDYILIRYSVVTREEYEKEGLITAREALDILDRIESRTAQHSNTRHAERYILPDELDRPLTQMKAVILLMAFVNRYDPIYSDSSVPRFLYLRAKALGILESRDLSHSEEPISFKTFYRMLTAALFVVTKHWDFGYGEEMPFQYAEELVRKK